MSIQDANGNDVEQGGWCARCGAHIKYVFTYNGKTYGSDCIEIVTGLKKDYQVYVGNELDFEASVVKKARIEEEYRLMQEKRTALEEQRKEVRKQNQIKYAWLINCLRNAGSDFCIDMANLISNDGSTTKLYEILTYGQYMAVSDVYAKSFGRRGSKAYKNTEVEFERIGGGWHE